MSNYDYITSYRNKDWDNNLIFKKKIALAMLTNSPIQNLTEEDKIKWLNSADNEANYYHYDYVSIWKVKSPVIFNRKTINKFNREFKSKNIRFREDSFELMTNPSKNDQNHWNSRHQMNNHIRDWQRNALIMLEKQNYVSIKEIIDNGVDDADYNREHYYKVETDQDIYFRSFQTQRRDGCHFSDEYDYKFVGKLTNNEMNDDTNISYEYLVIQGTIPRQYSKVSDEFVWNKIEREYEWQSLNRYFGLEKLDIFIQHPNDNDFIQNDERFKNLIKLHTLTEEEKIKEDRSKIVKVLPNN